jgi:hypothetical protein
MTKAILDEIIDIAVSAELTQGEKQFLVDVFEASEIDYWAHTVQYKHDIDNFIAVVEPADEDGWGHDDFEGTLVIDMEVLRRGAEMIIQKVLNKQIGNPYFKQFVIAYLTEGEDGDYDAMVADVMVQYGLFGEQVYA